MINYEILYQFCKNYTKEYENCEIIVDDFVQSLNPDLQAKIIMDCMVQKTNNNFRRF